VISTRCEVCGKWGHFLIGPPARATVGRFCRDCLPAEWMWESDAPKIVSPQIVKREVLASQAPSAAPKCAEQGLLF